MKAQIRSVQSIYASEWTTIINIKKRWPRPTATRGESAWMNKKAHRTHTHKAIASSCLELPQRWRSISNGIILAADKKKKEATILQTTRGIWRMGENRNKLRRRTCKFHNLCTLSMSGGRICPTHDDGNSTAGAMRWRYEGGCIWQTW